MPAMGVVLLLVQNCHDLAFRYASEAILKTQPRNFAAEKEFSLSTAEPFNGFPI